MSIQLVRVINQQILNRSILLDKIDRSQGNFTSYAQRAKQKLYVPYKNPLDLAVKGYVDLVPTDEVLLHLRNDGVIKKLADSGYASYSQFSSSLITTPVITAATNAAGDTTIDGTTFFSVSPDVTYVTFTNLIGQTQKVPQSAFGSYTTLQIMIPDLAILIGAPTTGWKVTVQSNSKTSNQYTIT